MRVKLNGFSLVELMVATAIVGTLAIISVAQISNAIRRAKQTEAKAGLGSYFIAQAAYYALNGYYTQEYDAMGFQPTGPQNYTIFTSLLVAPWWGPVYPSCISNCSGWSQPPSGPCPAGFITWSCTPSAAGAVPQLLAVSKITAQAYTVGAASYISSDNLTAQHLDVWTIDQGRNLTNIVSGL